MHTLNIHTHTHTQHTHAHTQHTHTHMLACIHNTHTHILCPCFVCLLALYQEKTLTCSVTVICPISLEGRHYRRKHKFFFLLFVLYVLLRISFLELEIFAKCCASFNLSVTYFLFSPYVVVPLLTTK